MICAISLCLATSWLEKCHQQGSRCLGTIITEWDEGKHKCNQLLSQPLLAVEKLFEIQNYFGFDGWLINIENTLEPDQIEKMIKFVAALKAKSGVVVWYDAVTTEGKLEWQNSLTAKNKPFFDVASGIFTNYTFKEDHLLKSAEIGGDRSYDIFAGVDVFGRGTFGGGEVNTWKSIKAAKDNAQNSAIFAPGWLVEKDRFQNSFQFWKNIHNQLNPESPLEKGPNICQNISIKTDQANQIEAEFTIENAKKVSWESSIRYLLEFDLVVDCTKYREHFLQIEDKIFELIRPVTPIQVDFKKKISIIFGNSNGIVFKAELLFDQ